MRVTAKHERSQNMEEQTKQAGGWDRVRNFFSEGVDAPKLSMDEIKELSPEERAEVKMLVLAALNKSD